MLIMTAEQFKYYLKGFLEGKKELDEDDTTFLKDTLNTLIISTPVNSIPKVDPFTKIGDKLSTSPYTITY